MTILFSIILIRMTNYTTPSHGNNFFGNERHLEPEIERQSRGEPHTGLVTDRPNKSLPPISFLFYFASSFELATFFIVCFRFSIIVTTINISLILMIRWLLGPMVIKKRAERDLVNEDVHQRVRVLTHLYN